MAKVVDKVVLDKLKSAVLNGLDEFKICPKKYYWFDIGEHKIIIYPIALNKFELYVWINGYISFVCLSETKGFVWKDGDYEDFGFESESAALACLESFLEDVEEW